MTDFLKLAVENLSDAELAALQGDHKKAAALAQIASSRGTLALAEEQRTTNRLLVALVDQFTQFALQQPHQGAEHAEIGLRQYLPESDWVRLEPDTESKERPCRTPS